MIQATQLRVGMTIVHQGDLCRVMKVQHLTPGNKRGLVQAKLRNMKSGNSLEHRFRSEDRLERAELEQHEMEFLYASGDDYHFMNTGTYEQITIHRDEMEDALDYLAPNTKVMVEFHENRPLGISLPATVDLKVVETPPGMKGATASGSGKPAVLETGLQVQVPQFIEIGETVRIDTGEGKYLERPK
jgi:elongation factor P